MKAKSPFYRVAQKFEKEPVKPFNIKGQRERKYLKNIKGKDINSFLIGWICERGSFFAYLYKFMKSEAKNKKSTTAATDIARAGFPVILPDLKKVIKTSEIYIVVPVPSRHGVSECFARELIEIINEDDPEYKLTYTPLLKKNSSISLKEISNWREKDKVAGMLFSLKNKVLSSNHSAILVDDIVTSGSSIRACARILTATGYKKVIAVSLATNLYDKHG